MRHHFRKIVWGGNVKWSHRFDYGVLLVILMAMFTMSVATLPGISDFTLRILKGMEVVIVMIFTVEYALRVWTAEKPMKYIFSFLGIIDLIAIFPFWLATGIDLQAARAFRLVQMIRVLKVMRYMSALSRLERSIKLVQEELIVFAVLAIIMIFVTAVGIYYFEHDTQPEAFPSIPHSIWFSVVSLTSVGYGDVTPITTGGRIFTSFILIIGLGIVAVPTALIVSGLTKVKLERLIQIEEEKKAKKAKKQDQQDAE